MTVQVQLGPDGPVFEAAVVLEQMPLQRPGIRAAFSYGVAGEIADHMRRVIQEETAALGGSEWPELVPVGDGWGYLYPEDRDLGPEPIEPVLVAGVVLHPIGQYAWPWRSRAIAWAIDDGEALTAAEAIAQLVVLGEVPASEVGATTDPVPALSRSARAVALYRETER